jgi:AcrR family transcriptional regulator
MGTKEKIQEKALEMFNETGIEYVGMREIARTLGIRVSNITYYFPTKDDLVNALWIRMNQLNNSIVIQNENITVYSFLHMLKSVFTNHYVYRCIMKSFVHLMQRNKFIADHYMENIAKRNEVLYQNIDSMISNGFLHEMEKSEKDSLVSNLAMIIRFWISDSTISFSPSSGESLISEYISNLARLLIPYATSEGKKEIDHFLA